jgi:hypothetical protein
MGNRLIEFEGIDYDIEIMYDMEPFHLRKDCDNLGIMYCSHSKYDLGDEKINAVDKQMAEELCWEKHNKLTTMGVFEQLAKQNEAVVWLPLSLHDHSGLTMFVGNSNGWDTGPVGIIYTTKEQMKIMGHSEDTPVERLEEFLKEEVKLYSYGLEGKVYRFKIEWKNKDGEWKEDSCGSFYGPPKDSGMAIEIGEAMGLYDRALPGINSLKKGKAEEIMKELQRCDLWY